MDLLGPGRAPIFPPSYPAVQATRVFVVTFVALTCLTMGRSTFGLVANSLHMDLGNDLDSTDPFTLQLIFEAALIPASVLLGHLSDQYPAHKLLGTMVVCHGGLFVIVGLLHLMQSVHFGNLTMVYAILAIFHSAGWPASLGTMAAWYAKDRRGAILGLWNSHICLGKLLAFLLSLSVFTNTNPEYYGLGFNFLGTPFKDPYIDVVPAKGKVVPATNYSVVIPYNTTPGAIKTTCDWAFPACQRHAPTGGVKFVNLTYPEAGRYCDSIDSCIGFISHPTIGDHEYDITYNLNLTVVTYLNVTFINTTGVKSAVTDNTLPNRSIISKPTFFTASGHHHQQQPEQARSRWHQGHAAAGHMRRRQLRMTATPVDTVVCRTDQYCTLTKGAQGWNSMFFYVGFITMMGGFSVVLALVSHPRDVGLLEVDRTLEEEDELDVQEAEIKAKIEEVLTEKRKKEREARALRKANRTGEFAFKDEGDKLNKESGTDSENVPLLGEEKPEDVDDDNFGKDIKLEAWEYQAAEDAAMNKTVPFGTAVRFAGVLDYAAANCAAKMVATGFMLWLPHYLENTVHISASHADELSFLFHSGGILGGVAFGLLSDYIGMRGIAAGVGMILGLPAISAYRSVVIPAKGLDDTDRQLDYLLLFLCGVFVNGVHSLISTAISADLGMSKDLPGPLNAVGTISGVITAGGWFGAVIAGFATPYIADNYGWNTAFLVLQCCAAACVLAMTRVISKELCTCCGRVSQLEEQDSHRLFGPGGAANADVAARPSVGTGGLGLQG